MDSDELIAGWVEKVWDGQDWDDSRLRDYLTYADWSPHIGLCTLSGFDYRTCDKGDNSAPSQFQFISTLCPSSFMSYKNENSEAEEQLLTRMNEDIDRLRGFWENSGKDIEGEKCKTADFIKWALSIPFHPHWLRWAIERKLYIPEQEADKTPLLDSDKASLTSPPELAMDAPKGDVPTKGNSALVFSEMTGLNARELTLVFVGDKSESGLGANNMMEVSARGQNRRIPLASLDLVNKTAGGPNGECGILLGLTQGRKIKKSSAMASRMKRLRLVFRHFGIVKDPFEPYRGVSGWVPLFTITDKRGAADERAKKEAEERMLSLEQLEKKGIQFGDHSDAGDDDDVANEWMKGEGHRF